MRTIKSNSEPQRHSSFGGHHGGGHHGGGFRGWGGWGYPLYPYPYPYYDSSLYVETPLADENFVVENGLIKKKKKKVVDEKKFSGEGNPPPRPIGHQVGSSADLGGKNISDNLISIGKHAGFGAAGAGIGAMVAYFTKQNILTGVIAGAVIGVGASFIHK